MEEKTNYLVHHGVKGQKWGVRRYQNYDGSLKSAGKRKVDVGIAKNAQTRKVAEDYHALSDEQFKGKYYTSKKTFAKRYEKTGGDTYSLGKKRAERAKKIVRRTAGPSFGGGPDPITKTGLMQKKYATKYASEYHKEKAGKAVTKLGRAYETSKAKNYSELSKHYGRQQNKTLGERAVSSLLVNKDYINTPYHRMSGRTTTAGKETVNRILLGIPGAVGDIKYLKENRKS